ncbi:hypothetical protein D9M68_670440 [compost metagenome]
MLWQQRQVNAGVVLSPRRCDITLAGGQRQTTLFMKRQPWTCAHLPLPRQRFSTATPMLRSQLCADGVQSVVLEPL